MSDIRALGYAGVHGRDLDAWKAYATGLLGLQLADCSASALSFRMDERRQRLAVHAGDTGGLAYLGWETPDAAALERLAVRLERGGVAVARGSRALADLRGVQDLLVFADPLGNRLEAFHGAAADPDPFLPGRAISGFVAGSLGLGHAVLTVRSLEAVMPFYRDLLGLRLTDYVLQPFRAFFFHVNARHHSLALIESGRDGLHHLMLELFSFDDVGQGYDLALGVPERVATTLGRHTNDYMTSFYARTPSDFFVEYGWGGRRIEVEDWQPAEVPGGPSLWGHERAWLPDEQRLEARRLRLALGESGVRAPLQVLRGNHELAGRD